MLSSSGGVGGAPGHILPCCGAGGVSDPQVTEREDTGRIILRTSICYTGRKCYGLHWAGGEGGVAAIPPIVGHHSIIAVHHGGTPWSGRGGVGALVVLHAQVGEGEYTLCAFVSGAGVWHTQGGLGAGELKGRGIDNGEEGTQEDEESHSALACPCLKINW